MKDRPDVVQDTESSKDEIIIKITVEKENSAKNIDLDISETEVKLQSEQ